MPGEDFTKYPIVTDGYISNNVASGGTRLNKAFIEGQLYQWILLCTKNNEYSTITPADLTKLVIEGSMPSPLTIRSRSVQTQGTLVDNGTIYISPSFFSLQTETLLSAFAGGWYSFMAGAHAVSAFVHANYYKRINIGIIENSNMLTLYTLESSESVTENALIDPGGYTNGMWYYLGYITVQNNGIIGSIGQIKPITQSMITSFGMTYLPPKNQESTYEDIRFEQWIGEGPLSTIDDMDGPRCPNTLGLITECVVTITDSGTTGNTTILLKRMNDNMTIGTVVIPGGVGTYKTYTIASFNNTAISLDSLYTIKINSVAQDATTIVCRMYYRV